MLEKTNNKLVVVRHREKMKSLGYKNFNTWILDTNNKDLVKKIKKECKSIRGSREEQEVIQFLECTAEQIEGWEW